MEGQRTCQDPKELGCVGGASLWASQEVICRRQAREEIALPGQLRFYCTLSLKVGKVVINEKEI